MTWLFVFYTYLGLYLTLFFADFYFGGLIDFFFPKLVFHYVYLIILLLIAYKANLKFEKLEFFFQEKFSNRKIFTATNPFFSFFRKTAYFIERTFSKYKRIFLSVFLVLFTGSITTQALSLVHENSYFISQKLFITTLIFGFFSFLAFKEKMSFHFEELKSNKSGIFLLLILLAALFLRLFKLGHLSPAGDEYRHLLAMKHYLVAGYFEYNSDSLVTYILIAIKKLFDTDSLFILRLPFAIIGSFSVYLIYLISKNLFQNKKIALISAYLFAILPLAIGLSRYIRAYEIELFVSLIFLFLLTKPLLKNYYLNSIIVGLSFIFLTKSFDHVRLDTSLIFILLLILSLTVIRCLDKIFHNHRFNSTFKVISFFLIFLFGTFLIPNLTDYARFDTGEFGYLFFLNYMNSGGLWYSSIIPYVVPALLLLFPFSMKSDSKNMDRFYAFFFVLIFVTYFYIYYFDAPRRLQIRYIYQLLPYFVITISVGCYAFIKSFKKNWPVALLIFFLIFSPYKAFYSVITEENGYNNSKNDLAYFDAVKLVAFIKQNNIDLSRVLTTQPWVLDYYFEQPFLNSQQDKKKYLNFPSTNWYDMLDRTKMYSINGYWHEENIQKINLLIDSGAIDYLILHGSPFNDNPIYKPDSALKNLNNIEPVTIIDADKTFAFYIYKVVNNGT